ncbi:MAG: hypothetical protein ACLFS3_03090 [Candidatus Aenigmatarchaeota archaeon]
MENKEREKRTRKLFQKIDLRVKDIQYIGEGVGSRLYRISTDQDNYAAKLAIFKGRQDVRCGEIRRRNKEK